MQNRHFFPYREDAYLEQSREAPSDIAKLGENVWNSEGERILGTPVGTNAFVRKQVGERLDDEGLLWKALLEVDDLQSAWQVLL